jgi:hypothetical protein
MLAIALRERTTSFAGVSSNEREFTVNHRVKPGGDERMVGSLPDSCV